MEYGFILFDENINQKEKIQKNIMSGVYCIYGQQPKHFEKIKDLPKNIIWYSNLKKEGVWRSGLKNIKSKDYLGISYDGLFYNFFNTTDKNKIASSFAKLFNHAMYSYEYFWRNLSLGEFKITEANLYEEIYKKFMQSSFPPNTDKEMRYRFSLSYLDKTVEPIIKDIFDENKVEKNNDKGKAFTFILSPDYYLNKVLEEDLPMGKWQHISQIEANFFNQSLKLKKEKLVILSNSKTKFLVKIDNLKLNPVFKENNWGSLWLGTRGFLLNGTVIDELWLNEKEFLFINKHAEFDVLDVYVNKETKNIKEYFYKKLFPIEKLQENLEIRKLSLSYQIIQRLFLKAFINTGYLPETRDKFPFTENMIWFKAKEREILFEIAKNFVQIFKCKIIEFGNGEITVSFDNEKNEQIDKQKLVEFLIENHLIVPYFLSINHTDYLDNIKKIESIHINENNLNLIDYKLKNKFIKTIGQLDKYQQESYFNFINHLSFIFSNDKKEMAELGTIISKMNFSQNDEKDNDLKWFLEQVNKVISSSLSNN